MVNFTKEHFNRLKELVSQAVFNNIAFQTKFGQYLNINELIHTTSINQLNEMENSLEKKINSLEKKKWVEEDIGLLVELRTKRELINLIVGYKYYLEAHKEIEKEKTELTEKLKELKEAQKTPEDRIKEIEAKLASLNAAEDFQ